MDHFMDLDGSTKIVGKGKDMEPETSQNDFVEILFEYVVIL